MLSRTSEYALQAVIYLARHGGGAAVAGKRIAEQSRVPPTYLANVLGDLVRAGVLESSRGIGGGFKFARPPGDVLLAEVLAPFEPVLSDHRPCLFCDGVCSDDEPCTGHARWRAVTDAYEVFLNETSVLDVSEQGARHPVRGQCLTG